MDPNVTWVAIDGGPGGGKSTGMAFIRQRLEDIGYRVIVIEEQATKVISRGFSPFAQWGSPIDFQRHILRAITTAEQEAYDSLQDLRPKKHTVILCDRGALSGATYIGSAVFEQVAREEGYALLDLYDRYKIAIFLVTAADGAEEYYTTANNKARSENPEQARDIDRRTQLAWQGHRRLRIVDNSTNFEQKIRRAFNHLARVLSMPTIAEGIEGVETERKFVIVNYRPEFVSSGAERVFITQDYLVSNEPGITRRARKRKLGDATTYFATRKRDTEIVGKRLESEPAVSYEDYLNLLQERIPGSETIKKWRSTLLYKGHHLEFDDFVLPSYLGWLHVLEVEVENISEPIEFPPELELVEVTDDDRFSNYAIAAGQLRGVTLDEVLRMPRLQTAA